MLLENILLSLRVKRIIKYFLISLGLFYFSFFNWLMPWYFTVLIALLAGYYTISKSKKNIHRKYNLFYHILWYNLLYNFKITYAFINYYPSL